jgi:hypothetical protein
MYHREVQQMRIRLPDPDGEFGFPTAEQRGYQQGLRAGLNAAIEMGIKVRFGYGVQAQNIIQTVLIIDNIDILQNIVRLLFKTTISLDDLRVYVERINYIARTA